MKNFTEKMKRFWSLQKKTNGGFTLVELIVVIAILAILAGIAVPAYSGYVEKARKAEDEQLLATVNTAFAAACIENGTDVHNLSKAEIKLTTANTVGEVLPYNETFFEYYQGSEDTTFKTIKAIYFDSSAHAFKEISAIYADLIDLLDDEDIAIFRQSTFAELGIDTLLSKVDFASSLAAQMSDPTSDVYSAKFNSLLTSSANLESLANFLGFEEYSEDPDSEVQKALQSLVLEKANVLATKNGGDAMDYMEQASYEIMANTAVLTAATTNWDANSFVEVLANGTAKDTIKKNINNDPATALSQAAFAYAMYTSYASSNDIPVSETLSLSEVYDTLASEDFQIYMNNSSNADVQGYLAAMDMLEDCSEETTAVTNLLLYGFNDSELAALITQATTK